MFLPERLNNQATGAGAILVGGVALLSLVWSALAYEWAGLGVTVVALLLLILAEFWREACRLDKDKDELEEKLKAAKLEASAAPGLRDEVATLNAENETLREEASQPMLMQEGLLESINFHVHAADMAMKHRGLARDTGDAAVTRMELVETQDAALVTASAAGRAELLNNEHMSLAPAGSTGISWGGGVVHGVEGQQIQIEMPLDGLPDHLLGELLERNSFNPVGHVLRLTGLVLLRYSDMSDDELQETRQVLARASESLTQLLVPGETSDDQVHAGERLAILEADASATPELPTQVIEEETKRD